MAASEALFLSCSERVVVDAIGARMYFCRRTVRARTQTGGNLRRATERIATFEVGGRGGSVGGAERACALESAHSRSRPGSRFALVISPTRRRARDARASRAIRDRRRRSVRARGLAGARCRARAQRRARPCARGARAAAGPGKDRSVTRVFQRRICVLRISVFRASSAPAWAERVRAVSRRPLLNPQEPGRVAASA
jgi:hypothetical protein